MDGKERDIPKVSNTPLSDLTRETLTEDEYIFCEFLKLFVTDEDVIKGKEYYNLKYGTNAYDQMSSDLRKAEWEHLDEYITERVELAIKILKRIFSKLNSHIPLDDEDYRCVAHLFILLDACMEPITSRLVQKIRKEYGTREKFDAITKNAHGNTEAVFKLLTK